MGFFSKIFKGVKKVFKKIGRGIKKVFKKIGKFMGKIGVVGQIALSFLLPGVGALIGKAAGAMMASSNAIISGAGSFLNAAVNIGSKAGSLVKSVGKGVLDVVGKTVGTAINKIPGAGNFLKELTAGKIDITKMKNFTGPGGIMDTASKAITDVAAKGRDLFSMDTLTEKNVFAQRADIAKQLEKYAKPIEQVTAEVSPDEFAERIRAGESAIEASIPKAESLQQIKAPVSLEEGFSMPAEDATIRSISKGQADFFPTAQQQTQSLLSPVDVPTLTTEEIAAGARYDLASPTGVTFPEKTFSEKLFDTPVGQKAQEKVSSSLTRSNLQRAIDETYGPQGEAMGDGTYTSIDVPDLDQISVASVGATPTQRSIRRTEISGYGATSFDNLLYTPKSSWGRTFAELMG